MHRTGFASRRPGDHAGEDGGRRLPPALLDLPRYAVIRAQAPTAAVMLVGNTALMYLLAFHR